MFLNFKHFIPYISLLKCCFWSSCFLKYIMERQCRLKKPTDLVLHCLPFSMWIYSNNLDQANWLAENWKWVWHLHLFRRSSLNISNTHMIFLYGYMLLYVIHPKYSDRQAWVSSVNPDKMLQNRRQVRVNIVCTHLAVLDASTGSKMKFFKSKTYFNE